MIRYFQISVLLLTLWGCQPSKLDQALEMSGKNRPELEKVLLFFENGGDKLKYDAAAFLIANMIGQESYQIIPGFEDVFDSIANYPFDGVNRRREVFDKLLIFQFDKMEFRGGIKRGDLNIVKSEFLIDNIEQAYKAWREVPEAHRASFSQFCEFILPYKCNDEPLEYGVRSQLHDKFSWVLDSLKYGVPLKEVVEMVTSQEKYIWMPWMREFYPAALSITQSSKSKLGLCDDGVNYFVNVFRSIGLIASKEFTPHWGNHHSLGHSWFYVEYGGKQYATEISGKWDLIPRYQSLGASLPKVYRLTFSGSKDSPSFQPRWMDVTSIYVPIIDITIEANRARDAKGTPVLAVYDRAREWSIIDDGIWDGNNIRYQKLGVNVLYLPGVVTSQGMDPIGYPFFINENKEVKWFKPDSNSLDIAIILRKYGLSSPRNRDLLNWIKNIIGGTFQGANDPGFTNPISLYTIRSSGSTQMKTVNTESKKKFKYVRFTHNEKDAFLSEVHYFDSQGDKIKGEVLNPTQRPLGRGEAFNVGMKLPYQTTVDKISYMPRTDYNHIQKDCNYELLYWNNKWISLGSQIAKDTVLYYEVPRHSLLWLKNHTEGKEEHVFTIDSLGNQKWLGFDNYN